MAGKVEHGAPILLLRVSYNNSMVLGAPGGKGYSMPEENKTGDSKIREILVHYIKSNTFRVIYAEGAHGGISPSGKIQMALYNERQPIPQQTQHAIEEVGKHAVKVGKEIVEKRIVRKGLVREVEAEILMEVAAAKVIGQWLLDRAAQCEKLTEEMEGKSHASAS